MQFPDSVALNKWIAAHNSGDVCLLSFSTGKDSIAAWLEVRRYFKRVIPFHLYSITDMEFQEKSLAYYERFFNTKILRCPHPYLYRRLNCFVFQPPERCAVIERADLATFDYEDAHRMLKEDAGVPADTWVATGVRVADNPLRQITVKKAGAFNIHRRMFMPVYDWKKARVLSEIRAAGVGLPVDYAVWGRSFDGLDWRFLLPLKETLPADYARVLELFPMADLEFARKEFERSV